MDSGIWGVDPLNLTSSPDTAWSTVNTGEAMPGVMTPLGWTFWGDCTDRYLQRVFYDLGALGRRDLGPTDPQNADQLFAGAFCGRVATNMTRIRNIGDRMPGSSGDAIETQMFGGKHSGLTNQPVRRRYPVVAVKLPYTAWRAPRALAEIRRENEAAWRTAVAQPAESFSEAVTGFKAAMFRFEDTMVVHCSVSMVAQALYDQVTRVVARSGIEVATGYGDMEETATLQDIWEMAHGRLTMETFLDRHGYHGPREGDIASHSWREDPTPIEALLATYKGIPSQQSPTAVERARIAQRQQGEAQLLAAVARPVRPLLKGLLALARMFILGRQVGKVAFLQTIDTGRAMARSAGAFLAAERVIDHPEDVFYLTVDELCERLPSTARELIALRKERRADYERLQLPSNWRGQPQAVPLITEIDDGAGEQELRGLCGSAGVVDGPVRIVHDPALDLVDEGDILVCQATDPSWAPLLFLARALVVDIGGPMSHAAIVARELGIPCVVNTLDGTLRLRDGEVVHVDGSAGLVTTKREGAVA